jgi:integrase
MYYAALRPSEAVVLGEGDLHLPTKGWGRIDLAASASRAGTAWTDHGTERQERGLNHRADNETRTIPIPPELVRLLRAHIKRYGTTLRRAGLPDRPGRHPAGLRLQRGLDRGPQAGTHPRPAARRSRSGRPRRTSRPR